MSTNTSDVAGPVGASIVNDLPVGGGGTVAITDVAARVARAVVLEATAADTGHAGSALARNGPERATALEGLIAPSTQATWFPEGDQQRGQPPEAGPNSGGADIAVTGTASTGGGAGGSPAVGPSAGGGVAALAGSGSAEFDRLWETLEERVLREIERRGGRYRGVF
jgi:hypothetical protein